MNEHEKILNLLHDRDGELHRTALAADLASIAVEDELWLRHNETRARLERLGFDTATYRPPPRPQPSERYTANHIGPNDDVEQIVTAAKERPLDRLYRELLATTQAAAADTTPAPTGQPLVRRGIGHVTGVR